MPTKHIPDATWRKVEIVTVKAVTKTQCSLKDTEILNLLILKGLSAIEDEDLEELAKKRRQG